MTTNSNFCAKQLSVSGVGLDANVMSPAIFSNNVHVENRHQAVPRLLKNLIIVCAIKNQKSRLKLLSTLKNRQLNLHRHNASFDVLNDPMQPSVVNVDVGNLHACPVG